MATKFFRTSDLVRAVGTHPNMVRIYADWRLIPPVERSPVGYRLSCCATHNLHGSAEITGVFQKTIESLAP